MARTYQQVIDRVRRLLQDEDATNYRYSEESLADAVNDALLEFRRLRPDLLLSQFFMLEEVPSEDMGTTPLPVEDQWFMALVYIVSGNQMLRDDEFSHDHRAVNLLNKGLSQMLTVNA